jgi:hypothetical protein
LASSYRVPGLTVSPPDAVREITFAEVSERWPDAAKQIADAAAGENLAVDDLRYWDKGGDQFSVTWPAEVSF